MIDRLNNVDLTLSPLAKRGLTVFALIIAFLMFDNLSRYLEAERAEQDRLQAEYAQLLSIRDSADPAPLNDRAQARLTAFEAEFLSEATPGLNSAAFQSRLIEILSGCGAQQPVLDLDIRPVDNIPGLSRLEADVRARTDVVILADCLNAINQADIKMHVDTLRWTSPVQTLFRVQAFALISQTAEAGS
jgi:hypothetical protein